MTSAHLLNLYLCRCDKCSGYFADRSALLDRAKKLPTYNPIKPSDTNPRWEQEWKSTCAVEEGRVFSYLDWELEFDGGMKANQL